MTTMEQRQQWTEDNLAAQDRRAEAQRFNPMIPTGTTYNPDAILLFFGKVGIPPCEFEWQVCPLRKWRFDLAWPAHKLAVEVHGGIYSGGRHVTAKGFLAGRGTVKIAEATRADLLPKDLLRPGDLLCTADGTHVMVVLDEHSVIEADPVPNRVIVAPMSDLKNAWMKTRVVAVRLLPP